MVLGPAMVTPDHFDERSSFGSWHPWTCGPPPPRPDPVVTTLPAEPTPLETEGFLTGGPSTLSHASLVSEAQSKTITLQARSPSPGLLPGAYSPSLLSEATPPARFSFRTLPSDLLMKPRTKQGLKNHVDLDSSIHICPACSRLISAKSRPCCSKCPNSSNDPQHPQHARP